MPADPDSILPALSALGPALEATDLRIWEWDLDSRVLRWSGDRDDSPGTYPALLARVHPQDRRRLVERVEATLADGRPLYLEYRMPAGTGSQRWYRLAGGLIRDPGGRARRLVGICQEITACRTASDRLRQVRQRHTEAEALVHLGSWELDLRTGLADWSEEEYRLLGYRPGEFPASYQRFLDAVHPADRAAVVLEIERALQGEVPLYRVEHRVNLSDGSERHVLQQGRVSFDTAGKPVRMIGSTLDITERVRAERALQQSHAQWEHIMDFFRDAVYVVDLEDRVVRANRAFYELTGLAPGSAPGRSIMDIMHPRGEPVPCPVCRARQRREDTLVTLEAAHPANPVGRPIEVMVRMIRDADGEISAILMALRDLSR